MNNEGSLIGAAGPQADVVAAIAANIWNSYDRLETEEPLEFSLIENERGRVVLTRVSEFLLCLYGEQKAEMGMMRAKAEALANYLKGPLSMLKLGESTRK